jgi:transposase
MSKKNQKRKRYSADFKTEVVRLMDQRGNRTVAEVAQSLGIAESLPHWKRQHDPAWSNDRGETPEEELRRLRREVADLKRDRDALAKSIAVFVRDGGGRVSRFASARAARSVSLGLLRIFQTRAFEACVDQPTHHPDGASTAEQDARRLRLTTHEGRT